MANFKLLHAVKLDDCGIMEYIISRYINLDLVIDIVSKEDISLNSEEMGGIPLDNHPNVNAGIMLAGGLKLLVTETAEEIVEMSKS